MTSRKEGPDASPTARVDVPEGRGPEYGTDVAPDLFGGVRDGGPWGESRVPRRGLGSAKEEKERSKMGSSRATHKDPCEREFNTAVVLKRLLI